MNRTATSLTRRPVRGRRAAVVLAVLLTATLATGTAQGVPPRDPAPFPAPAPTAVPCFIAQHDWPTDLYGPPPTCYL